MIFFLWYFFSDVWKDGLFKKIALEYDLSCIIRKSGIFFPKTWYLFFGRGAKGDLSREIHGNMTFSVYACRCYKRDATPPCQKNQRWLSPAKIHLRVTDILERAPIRDLCTLTLTLSYIASQRRKPGNLIYRIEVWLLPQFIQLEIFYNGESSIRCTIEPSGVVFGGVLERQSRKLLGV